MTQPRRCAERLAWLAAALVAAACCAAHGQETGPSLETIIRGVEARADGVSFQGRFALAAMHNRELVAAKAMFQPHPTHMATLRNGFTDGVLELSLMDLAYDGSGTRWRCEARELVLSGMVNWVCADISRPYPHVPRELYGYSVSDGETARVYDRADGSLSIRPFGAWQDSRTVFEPLRWGVLRTLVFSTPLELVWGNDNIEVRYVGAEVHEAFPCHVWAASGRHEAPKGYFRMWIAPELDFGITRREQVEVLGDGAPQSASVVRRWDWDVTEGVPLHVPRRVQYDFFEYTGDEAQLVGPGWMWSRLFVVDEIALSDEPLAAEALDVCVPFDSTVRDLATDTELQTDPTTSRLPKLLETVQFQPPDPLGERLKTEAPRDVMWDE